MWRSVRLFLFTIIRFYRSSRYFCGEVVVVFFGDGNIKSTKVYAGHIHLQHLVLPELLHAGGVQAAAQEEHDGQGYGGEGGNINMLLLSFLSCSKKKTILINQVCSHKLCLGKKCWLLPTFVQILLLLGPLMQSYIVTLTLL